VELARQRPTTYIGEVLAINEGLSVVVLEGAMDGVVTVERLSLIADEREK